MSDKRAKELLDRALSVIAAVMRGDKVQLSKAEISDLYSDICEHLEGYNLENN